MLNIPQEALKVIDDIIENEKPVALFICGSYATGYERSDSDIDVAVITEGNSSKKAVKKGAKIEAHYINKNFTGTFGNIYPYTWLGVAPILNEEFVRRIANKAKTTIVKNEFENLTAKFHESGAIPKADILFPIMNFLVRDTVYRPWRMVPFERILRSEKAMSNLRTEYQPVFDSLESDGILQKEGGMYSLNPDYIFQKRDLTPEFEFSWKVRNSGFGFHYLKNLNKIRQYKKCII